MYDMILSIKPCYAKEILNGKKKYEFRKSKPKRNVEKVYIYESSPIKKIIGYFNYSDMIIGSKYEVWNKCKDEAGICESDYLIYYNNSVQAYAYVIENLVIFEQPINPYEKIKEFTAPQSYRYVKKGILDGFVCNLV